MSENCSKCHGKGKVATSPLNTETEAAWEPCHVCDGEAYQTFYITTEHERLGWFTKRKK